MAGDTRRRRYAARLVRVLVVRCQRAGGDEPTLWGSSLRKVYVGGDLRGPRLRGGDANWGPDRAPTNVVPAEAGIRDTLLHSRSIMFGDEFPKKAARRQSSIVFDECCRRTPEL